MRRHHMLIVRRDDNARDFFLFTFKSEHAHARVYVDYVNTGALDTEQVGATGADGNPAACVLSLFYSLGTQT